MGMVMAIMGIMDITGTITTKNTNMASNSKDSKVLDSS